MRILSVSLEIIYLTHQLATTSYPSRYRESESDDAPQMQGTAIMKLAGLSHPITVGTE